MVLSAGRKRSGGLDAGYNAGGAKKYEAAQDHHRTVPPVYPAREHQKTYRGDGDYSNHRCNGAEQRSLHPLHRIDDHARALGVDREFLGIDSGGKKRETECNE